MIVGQSGTGKTSALEKLPWADGVFIDTERKGIPFACPNVIEIDHYSKINLVQEALAKKPRFLALDSLTELFNLIEQDSNAKFQNYDIWKNYNNQVSAVFRMLKQDHTVIICTAIDQLDTMMNANGTQAAQRRIKVLGNRWAGEVESQALAVFYTQINFTAGKPPEYRLVNAPNGIHSAKLPRAWRETCKLPLETPNDINGVLTACKIL